MSRCILHVLQDFGTMICPMVTRSGVGPVENKISDRSIASFHRVFQINHWEKTVKHKNKKVENRIGLQRDWEMAQWLKCLY